MSITESSGQLARRRLRIWEFDYNIRYNKGAKNSCADSMSRIPTDGATTVKIDEEISCFITVSKNPGESLGDEEPASVETGDIDSIFQLMLSEDVTSSATTCDELVCEQISDIFCRKFRLAS